MAHIFNRNIQKQQIGYMFGLLYLCMQTCFAAESWQIIVLPDRNYSAPTELPPLSDLHSTISQGLTIALSNADYDVLNTHYLGLPNCILEDCAKLTDQTIRQAAIKSGKEVNLALLYQLKAFQQRQAASQQWYFSLAGRLLDLQTSAQQDAFMVENQVQPPAQNCISECLTEWLNNNLRLLTQDLGAVLSEKLAALPRRFHYQLTLNNFTTQDLQKIDRHLKKIQGYVADQLITNSLNETDNKSDKLTRNYQYISELSASELSIKLEQLNQKLSQSLTLQYDNTERQFHLIANEPIESWKNFSQFMTGLFSNFSLLETQQETQQEPRLAISEENAKQTEIAEPREPTDEENSAQKDQKMWQQAQTINTIHSYQQYLAIWPQGQFVILAQGAINRIQEDNNRWQQAANQNSSQAYQSYLNIKPQGQYRQQAKQQLARLREQQQLQQKQQETKALADNYYQKNDYPEALYYYQQAAKLGHAQAQFSLAKMYQDGKGTDQNTSQAAHWYLQAAKQGHAQAQATLGFMYSKGTGIKQDYAQAVYWYHQAAEQGYMKAQYNLAYLYTVGQGTSKDQQKAAFWFEKAALQGDADAQNSLGKLYERGLGVNQDMLKAKNLYQQAADQGHQMARINLRMLKN
ncbi:tetratricopeptide repeat protein [Paraglaciecola sp. L3A3]|uniref:tetratricopeptide repeat protein n=1 Tax=Paraglaciecola sp. L3A3 TaxID=2686358 RepID=UPI00131D8D90|nr:tetratricopeptide repeat protein [Paraglaciecola sp. L3A3]